MSRVLLSPGPRRPFPESVLSPAGVATAFFFATVPETKGRPLEAIEAGWR